MRLDPYEEAADRAEDAYLASLIGPDPDPYRCACCGRETRQLDHYDRCPWCRSKDHTHHGRSSAR